MAGGRRHGGHAEQGRWRELACNHLPVLGAPGPRELRTFSAQRRHLAAGICNSGPIRTDVVHRSAPQVRAKSAWSP